MGVADRVLPLTRGQLGIWLAQQTDRFDAGAIDDPEVELAVYDLSQNFFGTEPNVQSAYSIETFAWDDNGDLLIKTYYPMPESVGADGDPYAHLLEGQ